MLVEASDPPRLEELYGREEQARVEDRLQMGAGSNSVPLSQQRPGLRIPILATSGDADVGVRETETERKASKERKVISGPVEVLVQVNEGN